MSKGLKYTFLLNGILLFVLAIGLLFFPNQLSGLPSNTEPDPSVTFSGASLLAISLGSWLGFRAKELKEIRIIATVQACLNLLGLATGLYIWLATDITSSFVWWNLGFSALFSILFVVFFPKAEKAT
jgi:hypothetical protein